MKSGNLPLDYWWSFGYSMSKYWPDEIFFTLLIKALFWEKTRLSPRFSGKRSSSSSLFTSSWRYSYCLLSNSWFIWLLNWGNYLYIGKPFSERFTVGFLAWTLFFIGHFELLRCLKGCGHRLNIFLNIFFIMLLLQIYFNAKFFHNFLSN